MKVNMRVNGESLRRVTYGLDWHRMRRKRGWKENEALGVDKLNEHRINKRKEER
jgi:hypothetical protein